MKRTEIEDCVRIYREGVEAYAKLEASLEAAFSATGEIPLRIPSLRAARACLAEAKPTLELLGESLACLPEIAAQLTEERRISASIRRQAKEKGIKIRYDATKKSPDILREEPEYSEIA